MTSNELKRIEKKLSKIDETISQIIDITDYTETGLALRKILWDIRDKIDEPNKYLCFDQYINLYKCYE
jgi:hypothetical protein